MTLSPSDTVYTAELHGIRLALLQFVRLAIRTSDDAASTIFVDSQAAIQAFERPKRSSGQYALRQIAELLDLLRSRTRVRVHWLPGHCGVPGNERADEMAKGAAEAATPALITTPYLVTAGRARLRELAMEEWKQSWRTEEHGTYAREVLPEPTKDIFKLHESLERRFSTVLAQMQCGKIGLPAYLATLATWCEQQFEQGADPDRDLRICSCGRGVSDTRHILLSCPRFSTLRAELLGIRRDPEPVWTEWLKNPTKAAKAARFMIATGLLGQFATVNNAQNSSQHTTST